MERADLSPVDRPEGEARMDRVSRASALEAATTSTSASATRGDCDGKGDGLQYPACTFSDEGVG